MKQSEPLNEEFMRDVAAQIHGNTLEYYAASLKKIAEGDV
jgi:hypothetical protein